MRGLSGAMLSPAPKREDLGPGKVHPTRQGGQALNPEPLPHAQSMSQAPSKSASQTPTCLRHFLLGGLPQGKDVQAGTVGLRPPPLTLPLPHQSQTCRLSGRHPPSLQGHFTKAAMPNESVLPSSLSSGPRTACGLPEQALRALHNGHQPLSSQNPTTPWGSNKRNYSYHTFRPWFKLHLLTENYPTLSGMSHTATSRKSSLVCSLRGPR